MEIKEGIYSIKVVRQTAERTFGLLTYIEYGLSWSLWEKESPIIIGSLIYNEKNYSINEVAGKGLNELAGILGKNFIEMNLISKELFEKHNIVKS